MGLPRLDDFCWIADAGAERLRRYVGGRWRSSIRVPSTTPRLWANLLFWLGEGPDSVRERLRHLEPEVDHRQNFMGFQFPDDVREEFGVELTPAIKRKILGEKRSPAVWLGHRGAQGPSWPAMKISAKLSGSVLKTPRGVFNAEDAEFGAEGAEFFFGFLGAAGVLTTAGVRRRRGGPRGGRAGIRLLRPRGAGCPLCRGVRGSSCRRCSVPGTCAGT